MKVFISYRRDDSEVITGRIIDRLKNELPNSILFQDIESIPGGVNFVDYSTKKLVKSSALLLIIGEKWATILEERKGDEIDYVVLEIETALKNNIPIIPLLVENSRLPHAKQLPESIKQIVYLNAISVRTGKDFSHDIEGLSQVVKKTFIENANLKKKLAFITSQINLKPLLVIIFTLMALFVIKNYWNNPINCTESKISTIIANFDEDNDTLSESIKNNLDDLLPDSIFRTRLSEKLNPNQHNYHEFIKEKYFTNQCDSIGMFVNAYKNKGIGIINFSITLIGINIKQPEYFNESTFDLLNPTHVHFSSASNAHLIADFIRLFHISNFENPSNTISETYKFQEKHNISKDNEVIYGNQSLLPYVYLLRANSYALEGNDKRANQLYNASIKYGDPEITKIANNNKLMVQSIVDFMIADSELRSIRNLNLKAHSRIESQFKKIIHEIEKFLDKLLKTFRLR